MNPLITDQQIVALRKSRTTISVTPEYAWQDGAHDLRELYEQERTKLHELLGRMAGQMAHDKDCNSFGYKISGIKFTGKCTCPVASILADYNAMKP